MWSRLVLEFCEMIVLSLSYPIYIYTCNTLLFYVFELPEPFMLIIQTLTASKIRVWQATIFRFRRCHKYLDKLVDAKVACEVAADVAGIELRRSLSHDHYSSRAFRASGNWNPSDGVAHCAGTDLFPIG